MKTYFADPELKVIRFQAKDILTSSPDPYAPTGDPGNEEVPIV